MIKGKGEDKMPAEIGSHESRLSVSHAAFNSAGQVATASYDDTVKIYDFSDAANWNAGAEIGDEQMTPQTVIPHNNQTGRWVTMYVFPFSCTLYLCLLLTSSESVFVPNGNSNPPTEFNVL